MPFLCENDDWRNFSKEFIKIGLKISVPSQCPTNSRERREKNNRGRG
jgi:hypothetical protein